MYLINPVTSSVLPVKIPCYTSFEEMYFPFVLNFLQVLKIILYFCIQRGFLENPKKQHY